jgi:hypothetical protein
MQDLIKQDKSGTQWNCDRCKGIRHCLYKGEAFDASVPARPNMGTFRVESKADIPALIEWARQNEGCAEMPECSLLITLGICPIPLITPLSAECYKLYNLGQIGGPLMITDGSYYDQPAYYINALNVIASEQAVLRGEGDG